jgi:hypothetical protein
MEANNLLLSVTESASLLASDSNIVVADNTFLK